MSQHRSLKVDSVGARHRNVLSRIERVKKLKDQKRWDEEKSVFNLPKLKSLKIKVKKSAAKEGAPGAEGAAAPAAAGKPAAGAKPAAAPAKKAAAPAAPKK